jgi:hypothetical protein
LRVAGVSRPPAAVGRNSTEWKFAMRRTVERLFCVALIAMAAAVAANALADQPSPAPTTPGVSSGAAAPRHGHEPWLTTDRRLREKAQDIGQRWAPQFRRHPDWAKLRRGRLFHQHPEWAMQRRSRQFQHHPEWAGLRRGRLFHQHPEWARQRWSRQFRHHGEWAKLRRGRLFHQHPEWAMRHHLPPVHHHGGGDKPPPHKGPHHHRSTY